MERTIYAFAGEKGSGKSTATSVLVDEFGFADAKFADPLKNMMRAFYATCGLNREETERRIEGDLKETPCEWLRGKTPRHAMQTLGTEWRNMIAEDLWANIFLKRVERGDYGDKIACSDLRFPGHEEDVLHELGAYIYRITRPGLDATDGSEHASEKGFDQIKVNAVLKNTGTLEELREFVADLVEANETMREYAKTAAAIELGGLE